jgi:hypothetical protein
LVICGNVTNQLRKKTDSPLCICIFSLSITAAGVWKAMTEQRGFLFYLEGQTAVQLFDEGKMVRIRKSYKTTSISYCVL